MLQIDEISKSFGPNTVLDNVSFHVNPGEKIALVGPNGSGKSTLLNIVIGELAAESGTVRIGSSERLCYLRQGMAKDRVSIEAAECSTVASAAGALLRVRAIEGRLGSDIDRPTEQPLLTQYSDALAQLESSCGQNIRENLDDALREFGLGDVSFDRSLSTLSGGQKTRLTLAVILSADPNILLLDEPTNHLDIRALEWLESFVESYTGAALIVSHDRMFLDHTITRIVELESGGTVGTFAGNYSAFVEAKDARRTAQLSRWRAQEAEIRHVREKIGQQKQETGNLENRRKPADSSYKYWAPENTSSSLAKKK